MREREREEKKKGRFDAYNWFQVLHIHINIVLFISNRKLNKIIKNYAMSYAEISRNNIKFKLELNIKIQKNLEAQFIKDHL